MLSCISKSLNIAIKLVRLFNKLKINITTPETQITSLLLAIDFHWYFTKSFSIKPAESLRKF